MTEFSASTSPSTTRSISPTAESELSPAKKSLLSTKWNLETQTPHGGQEWRDINNFVEDFSVTTNALGTPEGALNAARESLDSIDHYPPSDFDPAWTSLASFLMKEDSIESVKRRLVLGNGASELIDLCIRLSKGSKWRPGQSSSQYMEYERSATSYGKQGCSWDDQTADLMCVVNPCNPTGDFKNVASMMRWLEEICTLPDTTVIVDESMQPWFGPNWKDESLTSQTEWIEKMNERGIKVYVLHSWTKLWSCPGLRIGSVLAPTSADADTLRKSQVPWSVNTAAIAFLDAVVKDTKYLSRTWEMTSVWRRHMCSSIESLHTSWKIFGEGFLSYIWIDTLSESTAEFYVNQCRLLGVPIRWGKFGYNQGTCIRLGVREPEKVGVLLKAFSARQYEQIDE